MFKGYGVKSERVLRECYNTLLLDVFHLPEWLVAAKSNQEQVEQHPKHLSKAFSWDTRL